MLSARLYQLPSHLYAEESAAITAAPRQCYKGYPDRKTEAEFALFSFICSKKKQMLPVPFGEQAAGREKQAASLWVTCW